MSIKIAVNRCYGGFGLSQEAQELFDKKNGSHIYEGDIDRDDPLLIETIEELGEERSSGFCGSLEIVEIPDDVEWIVEEYDGYEHIAEQHRTW